MTIMSKLKRKQTEFVLSFGGGQGNCIYVTAEHI